MTPNYNNPNFKIDLPSKELMRKEIMNGNLNIFIQELHDFIKKMRDFLDYLETGTKVTNNIVLITKNVLTQERNLFQNSEKSLENISPELMLNLLDTQEFQNLAGHILAQILKHK
ncbi:MAG: hypothetical protein PWP31_730 [Clostridia bacterium]|nr:hypothetical protein [Clostridia bacterium]